MGQYGLDKIIYGVLCDEAFKNYALFQQTQNILEFFGWASEFKASEKSFVF